MTDRVRLALGSLAVVVVGLGLLWWERPGLMTETQAALDAWAEFAGNGDVSAIDGYFVEGGPQYLQLVGEASSRQWEEDEYAFVLSDAQEDGPGIVRGTVTVSRDGAVTGVYDWEMELRRVSGSWQLWTVRSVSPP